MCETTNDIESPPAEKELVQSPQLKIALIKSHKKQNQSEGTQCISSGMQTDNLKDRCSPQLDQFQDRYQQIEISIGRKPTLEHFDDENFVKMHNAQTQSFSQETLHKSREESQQKEPRKIVFKQKRVVINGLYGKSIFDVLDNQLVDTQVKREGFSQIKVDGENVNKIINKFHQSKQSDVIASMRESRMNQEIRDGLGTPARWHFRLRNLSSPSGRSTQMIESQYRNSSSKRILVSNLLVAVRSPQLKKQSTTNLSVPITQFKNDSRKPSMVSEQEFAQIRSVYAETMTNSQELKIESKTQQPSAQIITRTGGLLSQISEQFKNLSFGRTTLMHNNLNNSQQYQKTKPERRSRSSLGDLRPCFRVCKGQAGVGKSDYQQMSNGITII